MDTQSLGADRAERIRACLDRVAEMDQPVGADLIRYDIQVDHNDGSHQSIVAYDEGGLVGPLGELIDMLRAK